MFKTDNCQDEEFCDVESFLRGNIFIIFKEILILILNFINLKSIKFTLILIKSNENHIYYYEQKNFSLFKNETKYYFTSQVVL